MHAVDDRVARVVSGWELEQVSHVDEAHGRSGSPAEDLKGDSLVYLYCLKLSSYRLIVIQTSS
jgi:hypothetical protein